MQGFRSSARALAAQNFTMPALSPTMTEGSIAAWRVKEGDKFAAGDVLLEIETDKATMDVEAQEDGFLVKITQGDGSKGIQVGTRIAVLAEEGDDISSLEIPAEEPPQKQTPQAAEAAQETAQSSKPAEAAPSEEPSPAPRREGKPQKQTYPLLPSVAHLMKENGLDESKVEEMTPTGPNGRLLKGDVLAYLGKVKAEVPSGVSTRFEKLSHLDLSNIKVAPAKAPESKKADTPAAAPAAPAAQSLSLTLPVSLKEVAKVQKKIQDTLGVFMPLSAFITRAADLANDELPPSAAAKPTADELFHQVLGLDKAGPVASRGFYFPQVDALTPTSFTAQRRAGRKSDIIDILAGRARATQPRSSLTPVGISPGVNAFSLTVPKAEETRAMAFLERIKLVLENEPGRLVL